MATLSLTDPVNGTTADATLIATNNSAIKTVVNGGIDNSNISSAAAIAASKLAGYPSDSTEFLAGDGTWKTTVYSLICDDVLTTATASFDTNTILGANISAAYNHLRVVLVGRSDAAAASEAVHVVVNNDSTSGNYADQQGSASGTTAGAAQNFSARTFATAGNVTAATAPSGYPGHVVLDFPAYTGTTFYKTFSGQSWSLNTTSLASGAQTLDQVSGVWLSTASITRLAATPASGNWIKGSAFYVYGAE